jgi:hypothetical protein
LSQTPKSGRRYLLFVYQYMLDRWWRATLVIGLVLLVLGGLPLLLPRFDFPVADNWTLWMLVGAGGFAILLTIFFASIRKSACVQAFSDHLRLVTPFLRLNISYKRIRRTSVAEMGRLFPLKTSSTRRRGLLLPLASKTAIILDLTSFPVSQAALRMFLSPLFFPDKTACLALLVPDWLAFSTELESCRSASQDAPHWVTETANSKLLASLKNR